MKRVFSILLLVSLVSLWCAAQSQPHIEDGFKGFGSYHGSDIDTVNLQNGNVMVHIPLISYPGRGSTGVDYTLQLGSKNWQVGQYFDSSQTAHERWMLSGKPGLAIEANYDLQVQRVRTITTDLSGNQTENDFNYAVRTPDNSVHWFAATAPNGHMMTTDGSNFQFILTRGTQFDHSDDSGVLIDDHGHTFSFPNLSLSFGKLSPASGSSANVIAHVGGWNNTKLTDGANTVQTFNDVGIPGTVTDGNGNTMSFAFSADRTVITGPSLDANGRIIPFGVGNPSASPAPNFNGCSTSMPTSSALLFTFPGPDGRSSTVEVCFATLSLAPAFSQPNVEAPKNDSAFQSYPPGSLGDPISTVIMPDGTSWSFIYDNYGNIAQINLPTGGSISYVWTEISLPTNTCQDGSFTAVSRAVLKRTVNDLVNPPQTWQYTWGTLQADGTVTNYVLDPNGNETAHQFQSPVAGLPCALYEIETRNYQGTHAAGTLLKTVDTHYTGVLGTNGYTNFPAYVSADKITTTLPGNKISQVVKQYDTGVTGLQTLGNVVDEKVYDYGQGAPGTLLRETSTSYLSQTNTTYFNAGFLHLPSSVVVKDGNGCKMSETDYEYDEAAYANINYELNVGALPTGTHAAVSTPRGNLTTTTHQRFDHSACTPASQTAVSSHTIWYDTGEPRQQIDPLGHTTTISYDQVYLGGLATQTCSPSTNGVSHCVSGTYDALTGLLENFTNENATLQYFNFGSAYPFSIQKQKSITTTMDDLSTSYLMEQAGRITASIRRPRDRPS